MVEILRTSNMFSVTHLLLLLNLFFNYGASVVVDTEQGQVRGETLQAVTGDFGYDSFKGIPYAAAPVGDLRFMAPQAHANWTGVRNATQHGSVCIQGNFFDKNDIFGSEDCLYLNVYTRNVNPGTLQPVMFFIHGGSLERGSGNVERYGPDYLLAENVVLVTINYRLGPFGFLSMDIEEALGNAGLKDQVAAMKWVHKNIANFGGDPTKVTIFGQSAGAVCVGLHNVSPKTKGLYKRSILMSGSPFNDWAWPFQPRKQAFRLGQQIGLWTRDDQELITYLKSLTAEQLLGRNPAVLRSEVPSNPLKQLNYTPVIETSHGSNHFLTSDPVQAMKNGKIHDVDLMIGHTAMDGLVYFVVIGDLIVDLYTNFPEMVVPRKILENIAPANMFDIADKIHTEYFGNHSINRNVPTEFIKYMSDTVFNYGILKYAKLFSAHRNNTFMYKFSKVTNFTRYVNLDNKYGINEATDFDDLLYVFYPHSGNVVINKNSDDYEVVKKMCALYANFARYGNPTNNSSLGVTWPKYNNVTEYYLDINTNLTVGQHLDTKTGSFWDSIYEDVGMEF